MPDRKDLRDLEALLRPAICPLSGARPGGLPSPADRNCFQSEAYESFTAERNSMNTVGVRPDLTIKDKKRGRTGPQTQRPHGNQRQMPEDPHKIKTRAQVSLYQRQKTLTHKKYFHDAG